MLYSYLQQGLYLLGHLLQLRVVVDRPVDASASLRPLGSHGGRDHVGGELGGRVLARLLLVDQIHAQRELLGVELPLLPHVAQVPDVGQDVLGEPRLQQQVLDLDPGHEAVLVRVCLLEQRLVAESVPGIDHPGHSLHAAHRPSRLQWQVLKLSHIW